MQTQRPPSRAGLGYSKAPTSSGCPSPHQPWMGLPSWWPWPCPPHWPPPSSPSHRYCCSCCWMRNLSPKRPSCPSSSSLSRHLRRSSCHCLGTWPWGAQHSRRSPRSSGLCCYSESCLRCCSGSCGLLRVYYREGQNLNSCHTKILMLSVFLKLPNLLKSQGLSRTRPIHCFTSPAYI